MLGPINFNVQARREGQVVVAWLSPCQQIVLSYTRCEQNCSASAQVVAPFSRRIMLCMCVLLNHFRCDPALSVFASKCQC